MKKWMLYALVAAVLVGLISVVALAQPMRRTPEQQTQTLKDSLNLTKDQAAKVLGIFQTADKERDSVMSSNTGDRQARWESMRGLMEKTDKQIEALLTPEQKTKYDAMKAQRMQRRGRFQRN